MLDPPFVGEGATAIGELQAVPLENAADRSISGVYCRNGAYDDAVLLVDDFVHTLVVELGDLDALTSMAIPASAPS